MPHKILTVPKKQERQNPNQDNTHYFFDIRAQGILHQDLIRQIYYYYILEALRKDIRVRSDVVDSWTITITFRITPHFLTTNVWTKRTCQRYPNPIYTPDLSPWHCFLFLETIKSELHFDSAENIQRLWRIRTTCIHRWRLPAPSQLMGTGFYKCIEEGICKATALKKIKLFCR